jgi:hypothetical protein
MVKSRLILVLALFMAHFWGSAQYSETFSTPNKGYLANKVNDFSGVNWLLSAWSLDSATGTLAGRDAADYFRTNAAGKLEAIDLDHEVYWESPLLNIAAAGAVSVSVDLSWSGFDKDILANPATSGPYGTIATLDVIKVQYSVNGGAYTTVSNRQGGALNTTIGYNNSNSNGVTDLLTVSQGGITGNTLRLRVVVNINSNAETVTIDNVSVPKAGVALFCALPTAAPPEVTITNSNCNAACSTLVGAITAPSGTPCPTGFSLQYQLNGGSWGPTLPSYAQSGPAQTIKTRCSCTIDNNANGPASAGVTTVPRACDVPVVWLGTTANWNTESNWSTGVKPGDCSKVVVNAGAPNMPTVTGNNNSCFSLQLNGGARVNMATGAKLTITGR